MSNWRRQGHPSVRQPIASALARRWLSRQVAVHQAAAQRRVAVRPKWLAALGSFFLAAGVALLLGGPAQAQSIGISPGIIEVTNALRGAQYTRTFTIINQQPEPLAFRLAVTGEAAGWVKLLNRGDTTAPADQVEVPPNTEQVVSVGIAVPPDAPNRRFIAEIALQSVAGDEELEESGAAVMAGLALDVVIDVTGTQRLEGIVSDITVMDTEVGLPLRARMDFQNTGNVVAEPEVHLVISNQDGVVVGDVVQTADAINVESRARIKAEWDTTGQPEGPYHVEVAVNLGDEQVYSAPFDVRLWPRGTFTRRGELTSLTLANAPYPGAVAKLIAGFRNTGEIDTRAAFFGEVYRDGTLVDTASSEELLVEVGGAVELEIFVPVPERGEYTVEGQVNYEGKRTQSKAVSFKVPPDLGSAGFLGRPLWQVAVGGFLALSVAAAVGLEGRRWSQKRQRHR